MSAGASGGKGRWADLAPRAASALVMLLVAGFAVWMGGTAFAVMIAALAGGMVWELVRMLDPERGASALLLGILCFAAVLAAALLPPLWALPLLAAPAFAASPQLSRNRGYFIGFTLWVMFAAFGFIWLRNVLGAPWMLWLIGLVVATDVAGYFAGKTFGGPKLWPRVSPKKTWSGASAGWLAAALTGAGFAAAAGLGAGIVLLSVLLSMASQAGDIAESALKRKMGVKDSSALIPGHGGLLDRFDGMLGAAAMFLAALPFLG